MTKNTAQAPAALLEALLEIAHEAARRHPDVEHIKATALVALGAGRDPDALARPEPQEAPDDFEYEASRRGQRFMRIRPQPQGADLSEECKALLDELEDARLEARGQETGAGQALAHAIEWISLTARAPGEPELCPYCDGSGESTAMVGGGPDAEEVPITCPRCKGAQTLRAAYDTLAEEKPTHDLKLMQLEIFHSHATSYGWAPGQKTAMDSFEKLAREWLAGRAPAEGATPLTPEAVEKLNPYRLSRGSAAIWRHGFQAAERAHKILADVPRAFSAQQDEEA